VRRVVLGVLFLLIVGSYGGSAVAQSATGRLLVAQPSLTDTNFSKTVVLVLRHDATGAFGLIVNRFVEDVAPRDVLALFDEEVPVSDQTVAVHIGGPVQPATTLALHSPDFQTDRTDRVGDFMAVSPTADTLIATADGTGPRTLRIFFGYAGWAPGQLDQEIESGSWALVDATADLVFAEDAAGVWAAARGRIRVEL